MTKETTHRGTELRKLGWSVEDIARYTELWEYRQRWGAMNLERDDRLFLRRAEAVLPEILSGRTAVRKTMQEKSYYRWLAFYKDAMKVAEVTMGCSKTECGSWSVLMEEELKILDYYEPILSLPDILKARALAPLREILTQKAIALISQGAGRLEKFNFSAPLEELRLRGEINWKPLRRSALQDTDIYPILEGDAVQVFRDETRQALMHQIRTTFPSLANNNRPEPAFN